MPKGITRKQYQRALHQPFLRSKRQARGENPKRRFADQGQNRTQKASQQQRPALRHGDSRAHHGAGPHPGRANACPRGSGARFMRSSAAKSVAQINRREFVSAASKLHRCPVSGCGGELWFTLCGHPVCGHEHYQCDKCEKNFLLDRRGEWVVWNFATGRVHRPTEPDDGLCHCTACAKIRLRSASRITVEDLEAARAENFSGA